MQYSRKWVLLFVVIGLLLAVPVSFAAQDSHGEFELQANELHRLGLFQGSDKGFELERKPSRIEALVMLIRLLGMEEEARSDATAALPSHTFDDVPSWADSYVRYAYHHQLTAGVSQDKFGSSQDVTAAQYFTFILRALGYDDAQGDFHWEQSVQKATEVGIVTEGDYITTNESGFVRGHMVDISYAALQTPIKGEQITLLEKLVDNGTVAREEQLDPPVREIQGNSFILPTTFVKSEGQFDTLSVNISELKQYLPDFYALRELHFPLFEVQLTEAEKERVTMLRIAHDLHSYSFSLSQLQAEEMQMLVPRNPSPSSGLLIYYLLDQGGNVLAFTTIDELSNDRTQVAFKVDAQAKIAAVTAEAMALIENAQYFPHSITRYEDYDALFKMTDGTMISKPAKTIYIDRDGLPASARAFTRDSNMAFQTKPEAEIRELLLFNRLSYLSFVPYGIAESFSTSYTDEAGSSFGLTEGYRNYPYLILLLEDDHGKILAYTEYTLEQLIDIFEN